METQSIALTATETSAMTYDNLKRESLVKPQSSGWGTRVFVVGGAVCVLYTLGMSAPFVTIPVLVLAALFGAQEMKDVQDPRYSERLKRLLESDSPRHLSIKDSLPELQDKYHNRHINRAILAMVDNCELLKPTSVGHPLRGLGEVYCYLDPDDGEMLLPIEGMEKLFKQWGIKPEVYEEDEPGQSWGDRLKSLSPWKTVQTTVVPESPWQDPDRPDGVSLGIPSATVGDGGTDGVTVEDDDAFNAWMNEGVPEGFQWSWLNDRYDDYPHFLILGKTGSGKTYLAERLAKFLHGSTLVVTPKKGVSDFLGMQTIGVGYEYRRIALALSRIASMVIQREVALQAGVEPEPLTVLIDEFPAIAAECVGVVKDVKTIIRTARTSRIRLIILAQGSEVKTLGIEGEGSLRDNLNYIRLKDFAKEHAAKNNILLPPSDRPCLVDSHVADLQELMTLAESCTVTNFKGDRKPENPVAAPVAAVEPEPTLEAVDATFNYSLPTSFEVPLAIEPPDQDEEANQAVEDTRPQSEKDKDRISKKVWAKLVEPEDLEWFKLTDITNKLFNSTGDRQLARLEVERLVRIGEVVIKTERLNGNLIRFVQVVDALQLTPNPTFSLEAWVGSDGGEGG